ncbi:BON domain-containing protein [Oleidesulfovibrio sp.]|uniref:BON domain-containing protein n=1 Tax=Oleidesulfovibrio sp. TaxID=2909707 RepID=UPI003A894677
MKSFSLLRRFAVSALLLASVMVLPGCMGMPFSGDEPETKDVPLYERNQAAEEEIRATIEAMGDSAAGLTVYAWENTAFILGEADEAAFTQVVRAARKASGIKGVASYVFPPAGDTADVHDNSLAGRVMDALSTVDGIDLSEIVIDTVRKDVVLMGTVASNSVASAAVAAARKVEGVSRVRSYLHSLDGMGSE